MITRPLLHQRAPIGQARVPPHNEASPRTARPPCTPCRSPLARAQSVDSRIRCHVTGSDLERTPHDHPAPTDNAVRTPWPHRASGPDRTPHDHLAAPRWRAPNWSIRESVVVERGSRIERTPHDHQATAPPARAHRSSPGATAQRGEPADRAAAMHTLSLPAGACPIGRFENPLPRNGDPTLSARPMITRHPPTTRFVTPWPHRASGPDRTPHDHLAAPRWRVPARSIRESVVVERGSRIERTPHDHQGHCCADVVAYGDCLLDAGSSDDCECIRLGGLRTPGRIAGPVLCHVPVARQSREGACEDVPRRVDVAVQ